MGKYVTEEHCSEEHKTIHAKLDEHTEILYYLKGKAEAHEQGNRDWWSRLGIIGVFLGLIWTYLKGGA